MTYLPFALPLAALLALPVAWRGLTHPETPMTTALAESLLCAVAALAGIAFGWIQGRHRPVKHTVAYKRGLAVGWHNGRTSGERERDRLQAELDDLRAHLITITAAAAATHPDADIHRHHVCTEQSCDLPYDHQEAGL